MPMIGGMVSSTLLTVLVISAIYGLVKGMALRPRSADIPIATRLGEHAE